MVSTVHKPVHVKTKQQKVLATISSAEIHITCSLMNKLMIFMIVMKKLDLFTQKNTHELNLPVVKENKVQFI